MGHVNKKPHPPLTVSHDLTVILNEFKANIIEVPVHDNLV